MKDDFQDDELWQLLGKSRPVKPSPFFVHNVVRAARTTARRASPPFLALWKWCIPATAAAALILFISLFSFGPSGTVAQTPVLIEEIDLEVVANLDLLTANDTYESWYDTQFF